MEELYGAGRIIRPAYRSVFDMREYVPLEERDAAAASEKGAAGEKGAGVTDGQ
jgi:citrate synthase